MDELALWHRGFHQPFRHEPPVGPESVRERGETFGITLDGEEVDTCRAPIWDVTDSKTQISHEAMLDNTVWIRVWEDVRMDGEEMLYRGNTHLQCNLVRTRFGT